jgi:hypothetical protein
MTEKFKQIWEKAGIALGKNKKDAEERFIALRPTACKQRTLRLTYTHTETPYRYYNVEWTTINKYGKHIMFR